MNLEGIVKNVVKDYGWNWPGVETIENVLSANLKNLNYKVSKAGAYAVCMYSLCLLGDTLDYSMPITVDAIKGLLSGVFPKSSKDCDDLVVQYGWYSKEMYTVLESSQEIFEIAQRTYVKGERNSFDKVKATLLFEEIEEFASILDQETFIYRSKSSLVEVYHKERSESKKELRFIRGESERYSQRLSTFVESLC